MEEQPLSAITDPIQAFQQWFSQAEASEPNDPNAASLATASSDGSPSVRVVLVKQVDARGFCFFTNAESQKGVQLSMNPRAALCYHWKSLRRQVRVEGHIVPLADADVDTYFHSRSRRSQIGAAVSQQSRPLPDRKLLESQVEAFTDAHPDEVPRPDYWRGYCLVPDRVELWMDGPDRLHDRFLFSKEPSPSQGWSKTRLYP